VARKLMQIAMFYALKDGTRKLFLNTDPTGFVLDFYKKLGFSKLTPCETIWGGGKPFLNGSASKNFLFPIKLHNKKELNLVFKIYETCMGKRWITFFKNNVNNFIFGYAQEYKNFFQRSIFLSEEKDCFVSIYKRPFKRTAFIDVFFSQESKIESVFSNLIDMLKQKNFTYLKITFFNVKTDSCFNMLKKHKFYPYSTIFLGKEMDTK
jgi:hypothetical protein